MRDPARIDIFCDKLKELWYLNPELRFPQIFYILLDKIDNKDCSDDGFCNDGFYIEDDEWLEVMQTLINNYNE